MNMPAAIVLFVCKTVLIAGPPDPNAAYTGHENRDWDYTGSVMHCRRIEMPLIDQSEMQGATPRPFNQYACNASIALQGPLWDEKHKNSSYRFWRGACAVPTVDLNTGKILSWNLPDCPTEDGTVECELDTKI